MSRAALLGMRVAVAALALAVLAAAVAAAQATDAAAESAAPSVDSATPGAAPAVPAADPAAVPPAEPAAGERMSVAERFKSLDRNGDGRLDKDELARPDLFEQMDRDGDGAVTADEARAFVARRARAAAGGMKVAEGERPPMPEVVRKLNIPYARMEGVEPNLLSLDVYSPSGAGKHPVMVMVHGGGWSAGDKALPAMTQLKVPHFVGHGYVYVSINYRLSPKVVHPAHVQDVAAALAYLYDHVAEYGGDPDRLFIMGHSAGAHLVGLVATDDRHLKAHGKDLRIIKGVVSLDNPGGFDIPRLMDSPTPAGGRVYETAFGAEPKGWKDASAITYVAKDKHIPPMLIILGEGRPESARQIVAAMIAALAKVGVSAGVVEAVGKDHGGVNMDIGKVGDAETAIILAFLSGTDPRTFPARTTEYKPPAAPAAPAASENPALSPEKVSPDSGTPAPSEKPE
ncbi:MAG: alpha/beta hydrolase fold domain-containing protein [Phycisphaerae bacterium]|nr:alpha/beta hydrolase fold domain-containing protein [Phycisphaerae bacterium]